MSEWQPIKSAVQGSAILYDEDCGVILDGYLFDNSGVGYCGYYNNKLYKVTHWMPLPKPPTNT